MSKIGTTPSDNSTKKHLSALSLPISILVLIICLTATIWAWHLANKNLEQQSRDKFHQDVKDIESAIFNRMEIYYNVLYGLQGLYESSETVSRTEFKNYVKRVDVAGKYPGISSLAFLEIIKANEKEQFIREMKIDSSVNGKGYPNITIYPEVVKDEYVVFKYIEPESSTSAFGFDYTSEADRKDAVDRARETGTPSATAIVQSITTKQPAFVMLLPVYTPTKSSSISGQQDRHIGYVSAGFRPQNLFNGIFGQTAYSNLNYEIHDTTHADLIHDKSLVYKHTKVSQTAMDDSHQIIVGGRTWLLKASAPRGYGLSADQNSLPQIILFGGIGLSVLLFGVLYSISSSRNRAVALAHSMTKQLQAGNKELTDYIDTMKTFNAKISPTGDFILFNKAMLQFSGLSDEELRKKNFLEGKWWAFDSEVQNRVKVNFEKTKNGEVITYDEKIQVASGEVLTINFSMTPVLKDGKVIYIVAEGRDISIQKKLEEELKERTAEAERLNKITVDRELKMVELKDQIKSLQNKK